MKFLTKNKPERIEEFNGYIIRTIRDAHAIIAIPKDAICYWHRRFKFETDHHAFRVIKGLINENEMFNLSKKKRSKS